MGFRHMFKRLSVQTILKLLTLFFIVNLIVLFLINKHYYQFPARLSGLTNHEHGNIHGPFPTQKARIMEVGSHQKRNKPTKPMLNFLNNRTSSKSPMVAKYAGDVPDEFDIKVAKAPKLIDDYQHNRLFYNSDRTPVIFKQWKNSTKSICNGKVVQYIREFVYFTNLVINKTQCVGRAGGEEIQDVIMQREEDEYFEFRKGCFIVDDCKAYSNSEKLTFVKDLHLNKMSVSVVSKDVSTNTDLKPQLYSEFYIVIVRYEYANMYHTMSDWYNAFLVMNFYEKTPKQTNVILFDGHPKGALDQTWNVLFNTVTRASELPALSMFDNIAWGIIGYQSPMLQHHVSDWPLVEEFRDFFLSSHRINPDKSASCHNSTITFLWRRNYLAHPRNPAGKVSRQFKNEKEIYMRVRAAFPYDKIQGVQIDLLPVKEQLFVISQTDILIGMHGAGLTHTWFLPKNAALIETNPTYWSAMDHFKSIADNRNLAYGRWINIDPKLDSHGTFTYVNPRIIIEHIRTVKKDMGCITTTTTTKRP